MCVSGLFIVLDYFGGCNFSGVILRNLGFCENLKVLRQRKLCAIRLESTTIKAQQAHKHTLTHTNTRQWHLAEQNEHTHKKKIQRS